MSAHPWRYAVLILREDLSEVGQLPVELDWEPFREWLRFVGLRQGMAAEDALALDSLMEPIWHRERGEPFVEGIRARARSRMVSREAVELGTEAFVAPAKGAIAKLVEESRLTEGESVRYLPMAFAVAPDEPSAVKTPLFRTQSRVQALAIEEISLGDLVARSQPPLGGEDAGESPGADDVPVFLPQSVIDEALALTRRVHGTFEIGGLLVGHLGRDVNGGGLLVQITGQLIARHIEADSTHLTFTSETWTEFRSALALRGANEIMLGWWHSHPVREWCKSCSEASQRDCAFRGPFLSAKDRLLHRAMFPRAYSLALVVNDIAFDTPTLSMFGWRRGEIESRGYHVLDLHAAESAVTETSRSVLHA